MRSKFLQAISLSVLPLFALTLFMGASLPSSAVYPGTIFAFGGTTCPVGSVDADGSSLLRAGRYANLYAAIGSAWGSVDGTHFNAPDLRGLTPRGVDGSASRDPDKASRTAIATGGNTGNNVGSYQADQYESHQHETTITDVIGGVSVFGTGTSRSGGQFNGLTTSGAHLTQAKGGNETRGKNAYVKYCVKY